MSCNGKGPGGIDVVPGCIIIHIHDEGEAVDIADSFSHGDLFRMDMYDAMDVAFPTETDD